MVRLVKAASGRPILLREGLKRDGFTELTLVGRGGTASVFKALNPDGETVALKVFDHALSAPEQRRFQREQESMALLSGVNGIVPLLGSGATDAGTNYLVLPYYPLGSLKEHLERNGALPTNQAIAQMQQVGLAVAAAHNVSIFHRDIKPGNLLLESPESLRLGDFGIAQIMDGRSLSNTLGFTPGYCPPEAFTEGRSDNAHLVDVYSLGMTLWVMLSNRHPFTDLELSTQAAATDPMVILKRIASEPIGPPTPETPSHIVEAIARATAKSPGDRHQSAEAFVADLDISTRRTGFSGSQPVRPTEVTKKDSLLDTPEIKGSKTRIESPSYKAALVVLAVVLIAVLAGGAYRISNSGGPEAAGTTLQVSVPEVTATTNAAPASPDRESLQAQLPEGVEVMIEGGVATLSGEVATEKERQLSQTIVERTEGIVRVVNLIEVVEADSPTTGAPAPNSNPTSTSDAVTAPAVMIIRAPQPCKETPTTLPDQEFIETLYWNCLVRSLRLGQTNQAAVDNWLERIPIDGKELIRDVGFYESAEAVCLRTLSVCDPVFVGVQTECTGLRSLADEPPARATRIRVGCSL